MIVETTQSREARVPAPGAWLAIEELIVNGRCACGETLAQRTESVIACPRYRWWRRNHAMLRLRLKSERSA
jgi:hypothetical protein